jgi:hypothetical protein
VDAYCQHKIVAEIKLQTESVRGKLADITERGDGIFRITFKSRLGIITA